MSQEEIERKIVHYEQVFDMSSQEFSQKMKEGSAPDTFETMDWMILLRHRGKSIDDPAHGSIPVTSTPAVASDDAKGGG
jgi:hypothetical protein